MTYPWQRPLHLCLLCCKRRTRQVTCYQCFTSTLRERALPQQPDDELDDDDRATLVDLMRRGFE